MSRVRRHLRSGGARLEHSSLWATGGRDSGALGHPSSCGGRTTGRRYWRRRGGMRPKFCSCTLPRPRAWRAGRSFANVCEPPRRLRITVAAATEGGYGMVPAKTEIGGGAWLAADTCYTATVTGRRRMGVEAADSRGKGGWRRRPRDDMLNHHGGEATRRNAAVDELVSKSKSRMALSSIPLGTGRTGQTPGDCCGLCRWRVRR